MKLSPGNAQDIGARKEQQDALGFSDPEDRQVVAHAGLLGVLADGMGGMALGAHASKEAVRAFLAAYAAKPPEEGIPAALTRALGEANGAVLTLARDGGADGEVGTTLAAMVVHGDSLHWISAGDSRIYLCRGGRVAQLTTDHVWARDLERDVAAGRLTPGEALADPERNDVTSYLGMPELTEIDRSLRPFPLQPGDRVLACSDGLYRTLSEEEIATVLGSGSVQQACERAVRDACDRHREKQDNITVMAIGCGADAPPAAAALPPGDPRAGALVAFALLMFAVAGIGAYQLWAKRPETTRPAAGATAAPDGVALPGAETAPSPPPATPGTPVLTSPAATPSASPRFSPDSYARPAPPGAPGKPTETEPRQKPAARGREAGTEEPDPTVRGPLEGEVAASPEPSPSPSTRPSPEPSTRANPPKKPSPKPSRDPTRRHQ